MLPAEAGLTETHVDFGKGCYPGQEPIARQQYRGKVNRRLRASHPDVASLRRYLVDEGFLSRDARGYWRTGGTVPTG